MYCSICGNELSPHLNYCNHCGARNAKELPENSASASGWIALSSAVLGAFGLFVAYNLLRLLLDSRLETPAILMIVIAYLCVMFGMFTVFIRHMTGGGRESKTRHQELPPQQLTYSPPPASFRSVNTAQLEPAGDPGSITEHTTRTLDEVLVERK
jgi:hypothetical protein